VPDTVPFSSTSCPVIKITGNQQRLNLFRNTQINNPYQSGSCSVAHKLGQTLIPQGQLFQRRVQMQIGRKDKFECQ